MKAFETACRVLHGMSKYFWNQKTEERTNSHKHINLFYISALIWEAQLNLLKRILW